MKAFGYICFLAHAAAATEIVLKLASSLLLGTNPICKKQEGSCSLFALSSCIN